MSKIHIYLIRHGRQNSSDCNVNVPLADAGRMQARLVGERLQSYSIERIYSSALIRAVETATIMSETIGMELYSEQYVDNDLREVEYGDMTGTPNDVIKERFSEYFRERDAMEQDVRVPGGENGYETCTRVTDAINRIIQSAQKEQLQRIAVVSHGGAIRSYLAGILGMELGKRFLIAKEFENTSITEVVYDTETKKLYLERLNDYAHLEGYKELSRTYFNGENSKK